MLLLQARPFFGESFVTSAVNIKEGRSQGLLVQHDAVKYFSRPSTSNSLLMTNVLAALWSWPDACRIRGRCIDENNKNTGAQGINLTEHQNVMDLSYLCPALARPMTDVCANDE